MKYNFKKPVTLIGNGLFLFPQINTCQNANKRSKIIQTNVLIEGMKLYAET